VTPTFEVVGKAFVPGILHAEALLGTLPPAYSVGYDSDDFGFRNLWFTNIETGKRQPENPRLGDLPKGWEELDRDRTREDPVNFSWFRDHGSGEDVSWDPTLTPKALEARGVKLESFVLM
jgi:hypothetical protein